MDTSEQEHLSRLRKTYYKRLCILELKEAQQGQSTPPELLMEIEELREKLSHIDTKIVGLHAHIQSSTNSDNSLGDKSMTDKKCIELTFKGNFSDLTPELQLATIRALAALLEIPIEQIIVQKVTPGSIKYTLELPKEAADRLIKLYQTNNPIVKDLGIREVRAISEIQKTYGAWANTTDPEQVAIIRLQMRRQLEELYQLLEPKLQDVARKWLTNQTGKDFTESSPSLVEQEVIASLTLNLFTELTSQIIDSSRHEGKSENETAEIDPPQSDTDTKIEEQ